MYTKWSAEVCALRVPLAENINDFAIPVSPGDASAVLHEDALGELCVSAR